MTGSGIDARCMRARAARAVMGLAYMASNPGAVSRETRRTLGFSSITVMTFVRLAAATMFL